MAATFDIRQITSSGGEPWAFPLFVGLAVVVLAAVHCWMELLAAWSDEAAKANEILKRASTAILTTAIVAWYALRSWLFRPTPVAPSRPVFGPSIVPLGPPSVGVV